MFASLLLYHCITHDCLAMMIKLGMTGRKWNISQSATPVSADQRCANVSADQRHQLCNLLKWGQCSSPRAAKNPIFKPSIFYRSELQSITDNIFAEKRLQIRGAPLIGTWPQKKSSKGAEMVFCGQKNCSDQGSTFSFFTYQNLRIWGEYWINIYEHINEAMNAHCTSWIDKWWIAMDGADPVARGKSLMLAFTSNGKNIARRTWAE